jgi:hypothetical protein
VGLRLSSCKSNFLELLNSINFQTFTLYCSVAWIAIGSLLLVAFFQEEIGRKIAYFCLFVGLTLLLGNVMKVSVLYIPAIVVGVSFFSKKFEFRMLEKRKNCN